MELPYQAESASFEPPKSRHYDTAISTAKCLLLLLKRASNALFRLVEASIRAISQRESCRTLCRLGWHPPEMEHGSDWPTAGHSCQQGREIVCQSQMTAVSVQHKPGNTWNASPGHDETGPSARCTA
jgi:hypothetical protein